MDEELRYHLERETEALVALGMPPDAARDTARQRFGSVALVKDDCRESWGMRAIDMLSQDVRFAVRNLRKYPSYTGVVLLTSTLSASDTSSSWCVRGVMVMLTPMFS